MLNGYLVALAELVLGCPPEMGILLPVLNEYLAVRVEWVLGCPC